MQKNRLASLVVFYVLLSATFSFIPVLAQSPSSSDIIQSILDESKSQVEQKITQLEENGIIIPSSVSAFYNDGLAEYDAALASLNSGNLDEARDHALEAMSLFEDATEALYVAEQDFQSEQQAILNEIFELGESISNSESDADELRDLASENNLNVNFTDYDNAIATALGFLAEGNLDGARQQYEIAQNLLADIYDQIHDEAYSNVDQRAQDFVANTITQLNEIIANASGLGISQSIIDQLQDIIDDLQNAVSTDDIIYVSDESSDLYDLTTENPEWTDEEAMEDADDAIEDAQEEIDEADEKIMEASDEGIDTILAEQKLDEARDKLTMAIASFGSEDFEDAEVLADEAKELAEDAKELAEELTEEAEEEEEYEEDKEDAEEAIADAQEEIDKADEKIMEASDEGKETALAEEQLMLAITTLTMAIASFDLGNFEEAEELAEEAEDLASEARGKLIGKTLEDLEDEIELEGMVETGSITVDGTDGSFTLVTEDGPVPI
ncbi:MAG: hypothetical protein IIA83_06895, partial [Thaumarchaeota archaeon]|nr:hypothetical protein [Nitrososphaerota archaeon]